MPTMKIGYDSNVTSYADADLFSFTTNPKVFEMNMDTQRTVRELAGSQVSFIIDLRGLFPRTIMLNGYFHGANKDSDLDNLSKFFYNLDSNTATASGLLRFYHTDTKFIYCFGMGMKQTKTGGRENFYDYVAKLAAPVPFIYSDTLNTTNFTAITTTSAQNLSSTLTNNGTAPSHVLQWSFTNNSANAVTQIQFGDQAVSGGAVQGNTITWNGSLTNGKTLNIYFFKMVNGLFKFLYYEIDSSQSGSRDFQGGLTAPNIPPSSSATFSIKVTGTSPNLAVTSYHRDSYWVRL